VRRADNLTTFICRLSWNLGASNSWNPQGLSIPVMGLLYLLPNRVTFITSFRIILQRLPKSLEAKRHEHEDKSTVRIYCVRSVNEENGIITAKDKYQISQNTSRRKYILKHFNFTFEIFRSRLASLENKNPTWSLRYSISTESHLC